MSQHQFKPMPRDAKIHLNAVEDVVGQHELVAVEVKGVRRQTATKEFWTR